MNSSLNLGENIPKPKIMRKILWPLPGRFHTKNTTIEESKDIEKIPLVELVGNLQTYEMGFVKIWKGEKSKKFSLKVKDDEEEEPSNDEETRLKAYITRKFKKFIKNKNVQLKDKDRKKSSFNSNKIQDKLNKEYKKLSQSTTIQSRPKYFGFQDCGHMKPECPTYFKPISKSKSLAATWVAPNQTLIRIVVNSRNS